MSETELLQSTVFEYRGLLGSTRSDDIKVTDTDGFIRNLSSSHDWSQDGARAIVSLANEYGVFILRNALALAIAFGKEDGDIGY